MRRTHRRYKAFVFRSVFLLLGLVCASFTLDARAQTDEERAGARAAAGAGVQAWKEGRWADVVDLFTRAESLVHSPGHLLYVARAQEKLGKLVSARETYLKITRENLDAGAPAAFRSAKADAEKELAAIEPRLPYVTVGVQGGEGLAVTVTMDGAQVPPALVGVPHPVDPGTHEFSASAQGMASSPAAITLKEASRETVTLVLQPAASAAPASPAGAPGDPAATFSSDPAPGPDSGPADSGASSMKIGGFVALGVGVVGLGVGTVFALRAGSKRGEADDLCGPDACPLSRKAEIDELDSDADSAAGIATAGFIVGGVGVAAGVTLLILSSRESAENRTKPGIRPWIGLQSAGFSGRF